MGPHCRVVHRRNPLSRLKIPCLYYNYTKRELVGSFFIQKKLVGSLLGHSFIDMYCVSPDNQSFTNYLIATPVISKLRDLG